MPRPPPSEGAPIEDVSANEIARMLAANMPNLVFEILPAGKKIGREWVCGNVAGDQGDSLKIVLSGSRAGAWQDFGTGEKGDALGLLKAVRRCSISEACAWASHWLSLPTHGRRPARPAASTARPRAERAPPATVKALWASSEPVIGTAGEVYLRARGIEDDPGPWVRFVPALPYWHVIDDKPVNLGHYPALLCGITRWPAKEPVGVHRIYLAPDGAGKARIPDPGLPDKLLDPKKTLGISLGGAVRLSRFEEGGELVIAEGAETALSVVSLDLTRPAVWACLGTAALVAVELPEKMSRLVIATDPNDAGWIAARKLIARVNATRVGVETVLAEPPRLDDDWNETLQRYGGANLNGHQPE